jgi:hypothetical protein
MNGDSTLVPSDVSINEAEITRVSYVNMQMRDGMGTVNGYSYNYHNILYDKLSCH